MGTIKVTVSNSYFHGVQEEYLCKNVDISDLAEMEYAAEECVGAYMDAHSDIAHSITDLDMETIESECFYMIEILEEEAQ